MRLSVAIGLSVSLGAVPCSTAAAPRTQPVGVQLASIALPDRSARVAAFHRVAGAGGAAAPRSTGFSRGMAKTTCPRSRISLDARSESHDPVSSCAIRISTRSPTTSADGMSFG